ncbi:MAG: uracil-DNA glycosylase [Pseudomonadota bacterium]|nr:uracil-DNA glycosylase [Sphingomonas sp.]MDQ3479456.1 uracil-DNA glycosylase [Pseudomonadota bacterium]
MGGDKAAISEAEAASALRWWLESGVDAMAQEQPRNWLEAAPSAPAPIKAPAPAEAEYPSSLEAFHTWLSSASDAPLAAKGAKPILPQGADSAEVMLLAEPPGRDEAASGRPIGGEAWELAQRMLAAIGFTPDQAYCANLTCFYSPGAKLSPEQLADCGEAARRHVALAAPKRLILFGDAPARALLGKPLIDARGHVHQVEGVRTVATFHPRFLLTRPSEKARAWSDLLLLMEKPK